MKAEYSSVPVFIVKLLDIVDNPSNWPIVTWGSQGSGFIIHDEAAFEKDILPKYFKHSNLNSFVRQLNMYHFVKSKYNGNRNEFQNKYFLKNNRSMLQFVRRKPEQKKKKNAIEKSTGKEFAEGANAKFDPAEVQRYLHSIQELAAFRVSTSEQDTTEEKVSIDSDISNQSPVWSKDSPKKTDRHVSFRFF